VGHIAGLDAPAKGKVTAPVGNRLFRLWLICHICLFLYVMLIVLLPLDNIFCIKNDNVWIISNACRDLWNQSIILKCVMGNRYTDR
jgi:hypothetical protein